MNNSTETPAAPSVQDQNLAALHEAIRNDLREMRQAAGLSQAAVGEIFGWNRDAVSKIERGTNQIYLDDYIMLSRFLMAANPGHPSHALVEHLLPRRRRGATAAE